MCDVEIEREVASTNEMDCMRICDWLIERDRWACFHLNKTSRSNCIDSFQFKCVRDEYIFFFN